MSPPCSHSTGERAHYEYIPSVFCQRVFGRSNHHPPRKPSPCPRLTERCESGLSTRECIEFYSTSVDSIPMEYSMSNIVELYLKIGVTQETVEHLWVGQAVTPSGGGVTRDHRHQYIHWYILVMSRTHLSV